MMEVIDRRRIKTKDMAPMTVVNPSFQMELFHDTSTIPPYPYNPNKNKNNNNDNNNSDNTTPKTIDEDITTPKQIITHADIHNNNNNNNNDSIDNINNMDNIDNNENIEMTGNNNARNRNSETSSLPPNWRYRNDTDNISFNNTNNLQYNTNNIRRKKNNNNQENQASNLTSMLWDWSQESWYSAYYKNIYHDDNNGENNTNKNINHEDSNDNNSNTNEGNNANNLASVGRDWSNESWESAYYKNTNSKNHNEDQSNTDIKTQENANNLTTVGRDWNNDSWESTCYKNNNTNMIVNDENINDNNESKEHDTVSIDSVPKSPPPPIPLLSRSTSTHSLTDEHIYESIEENPYLSALNLKTDVEFPKGSSTPNLNDSAIQNLIRKHSPSCPMFPHKPSCTKYQRRSLPLVSRIPKIEFMAATCPHDSVILASLLFFHTALLHHHILHHYH